MPPFLSLGLFLTPHSSKPHARLTNSRGRRSAPCLSHSRRYRPPQLIPTAWYIFRGVRLLNPKSSSSQTHSSHTLSPSTNTTSVHLCLCLLGFNSCPKNKILDLASLRKHHRLESIISNTLLHSIFFFFFIYYSHGYNAIRVELRLRHGRQLQHVLSGHVVPFCWNQLLFCFVRLRSLHSYISTLYSQ